MSEITALLGTAREIISNARSKNTIAAIDTLQQGSGSQQQGGDSSAERRVLGSVILRDEEGNNIGGIDAGTTIRLVEGEAPIERNGFTYVAVDLDNDGVADGWLAREFLIREEALPVQDATIVGQHHGSGVGSELHPGIDLVPAGTDNVIGTPVTSNAKGTVYMYQAWTVNGQENYYRVGVDEIPEGATMSGFGNFVVLETEVNGETYYQVFAHLDEFPDMEQGALVQAGDPLGTLGDTGNSYEPHLHWEIRTADALSIDAEGSIDMSGTDFYPETETELNQSYVAPNEFADLLASQEAGDPDASTGGGATKEILLPTPEIMIDRIK